MTHEHAHPHHHDHNHDGHHHHGVDAGVNRRTVLRWGSVGLGAAMLATCGSNNGASSAVATTPPGTASASSTITSNTIDSSTSAATGDVAASAGVLPGFDAFAETVQAFASGDLWLVESNGLPAHELMVGITSWQQQVPVAQPYTGTNAWQLPRNPELSGSPISARTGLFRGAIALAVNGVPIFNALNNRGDDAFLAGELDRFGGHCGRADDYHYHVAPLHLEDAVGSSKPIAYALDGFAIYGSVEPDGSPLAALDEYNGHIGSDGIYHYHGTTTYPYINGGLVGVVSVSDQVDPQPTTPPFRPAGEPLPGATITAFDMVSAGSYRLEYTLDGEVGLVTYTATDTSVAFEFTSPTGTTTTETYTR